MNLKIKFKSSLSFIFGLLLASTGVVLIALQNKPIGFLLLLCVCAVVLLLPRHTQKHWLLLLPPIAILGLVPINTAIDIPHMLVMGTTLILAVGIPYVVTKYIYRDNTIQFKWHHGRAWQKTEIGYIFVTAIIAYVVLPFYFACTGAYLNWTVEAGWYNLTKLFIGTNALGIWDELFFIATVLVLLKRHTPFWFANVIQAVLFTSFLFELGFTGWAPLIIYPFALLQGLIYKKTESLLYVITIHLTLDFVLYLALINAHHPSWLPIFITG